MKLQSGDEALDLVNILRHQLPKGFPGSGSNLSPDEQRQIDDAKNKLLAELVLGHDERTRQAAFATKVEDIERFIAGFHTRSAMTWLGVAFLVFIIIDKKLHAQLHECTPQTTQEEYFSRAAPRLKIEASMLSTLYTEGRTLEEQKQLLFCGTGDVPAVTLEFVATNRTKLLSLTEAIRRHSHREALAHYRDDTSRAFSEWAKYSTPEPSSNAADELTAEELAEEKAKAEARKATNKARAEARQQKAAECQAAIDAEVATFSEDDKFVVRTFQSGMVPAIATAPVGRPQFLDQLPERLIAYRARLNREVDEHTVRADFDPEDPVNLVDGLGNTGSIFEAEARIMAAHTTLAKDKRMVSVLCYRLHNEPALIEQWTKFGYHSLQAYAKARLGMGPEVYTFAKIGRALLQFRYLIADLPDHDSESFFKKIVHVERAIQTHKGDVGPVRHALITLSPADFEDFSKNAGFQERLFERPVTQAQLDQVYGFRAQMAFNRTYGHGDAMMLVALIDQDESRFLHVIFDEMEAELAAQAAITLADRQAIDAAPAEEAEAAVEYAAAV
jgi:hypothetical protein